MSGPGDRPVKTEQQIGRDDNSAVVGHALPRASAETEKVVEVGERPKEEKWQDDHVTHQGSNDAKGVVGQPQVDKEKKNN